LNANEIIGFPEPQREGRRQNVPPAPIARFPLDGELRRARSAEIARLAELSGRVLERFGPVIAVGFLYYEVLGSPASEADCARQADRLREAPWTVSAIIDELLEAGGSVGQNMAPVREPGRSETGSEGDRDRREGKPYSHRSA
jgi:hypothetical protein